ncbi:DUF1653 domain-containing protein [Lacrimispora sp.]|uniref:DUF1653 domain-containing protein n=1 Tax=Lacrimispora sp. TaxID=2719234 RepID=UPI0028AAB8A2|nr:DUF1653 domain-containing protein [Lacrimispora sp.]
MDRDLRPGDFYRHFKDKLYQILAVAIHSETREDMVVYQALYGTYKVYVRPYDMFVSEVDHEKYPDVVQKYRFEKVSIETSTPQEVSPQLEEKSEILKEETREANKNLLAFLDARTYHEKLEVLYDRKDEFSKEELLAICEILEIGRVDSEPEEKYFAIKRHLELQNKYDGARLR